MYVYRAVPRFHRMWRDGRTDSGLILQISMLVLGITLLFILFLVMDVDRYVDRFVSSKAGEQFFSLSGRGAIWQVAFDVWKRNPLFGYGPGLWNPEFRQSIGMSFAFSAHNQFLQSLSGAGLFGIAGAVYYLAVLGFYAIRFAVRTSGFTVALWFFLFIRCLTETPLSVGTLFNGDFFTHLLFFAFLVRIVAAAEPTPVESRLLAVAQLRST